MTRLELLTIVVGRARSNGFEFRRWYTTRLGVPWISAPAALKLLEGQRRYYALLFSHEFAITFWKPGETITFAVPAQTFQRVKASGEVATVHRQGFTRRSARRDAWKYHLREMALAEEPLRYIRRYLNVEDELDEDIAAAVAEDSPNSPRPERRSSPTRPATPAGRSPKTKPPARPLPTGLPAFLKRPYP